jgi:hypothetical protein
MMVYDGLSMIVYESMMVYPWLEPWSRLRLDRHGLGIREAAQSVGSIGYDEQADVRST